MKKARHRYLLIISLTVLCGLMVHRVETAQPIINGRFFSFPLTIGHWEGVEIAMGEYVYEIISTPYLLLRDYRSPRHRLTVNFSIVWFDDRDIAFHEPEMCLGGVGNQVGEKSSRQVAVGGREYGLDTLVIRMPGRGAQLVWYFYDVDGFITTSQEDIRLHVLKKRLAGRRASASFIRLMAPIDQDIGETERILAAFLEVMLPLVPEYTYTERIRT